MIPESLHLEGLHSYQDPVTVEFGELVEDGLFGIFGPTGSGKSTLLDAMTFALYGAVDRVDGNEVAPLMHPEAETLEVRYRFELGGTSYEARRRYRRPGAEGTPSLREAALRDVDEGEVLASQAREVEDEVRELLGMDYDQFTRAVFLPQGKFAQFLDDKPSDRVQLREEVFGLDRYGDRLRRRARDRYDDLEKRRRELEGELKPLQEATTERLEEVEAAHAEAADRVESLEERRDDLEEDVEAARDLRKALDELGDAREELEALEERDEEVDGDRDRLAAAEAAEDPVAILDDLEEERQALDEVREELEEARAQAEEAEAALEAAKERREDRLPQLEDREDELQQVRPRLRDLDEDAQTWSETREQVDEWEAAIDDLAEEGAEAPPEDLEADLADLRERAREGIQARREADRLQEEADDLRERVETLQDRLEELEEDRGDVEDEVGELDETVDELEARLHEVQVGDRAAVLAAEELAEGEPCPVCGAEEHPSPASAPEADPEELRGELEEAREALKERRADLERVETQVDETRDRRDERAGDLEEREDEAEAARERVQELRSGLPSPLASRDWDEVEATVRAWERGRRRADLLERVAEARERLDQTRARWDEVRTTLDLDLEEPTADAREQARERLQASLEAVEAERTRLEDAVATAREEALESGERVQRLEGREANLLENVEELEEEAQAALEASPFEDAAAAREAHLGEADREELETRIEEHEEDLRRAREAVERLQGEVEEAGLEPDEAEAVVEEHAEVREKLEEAQGERVRLAKELEDLREKADRRAELEEEMETVDERMGRADALRKLLRGRGFVRFLARSRFQSVLDHASRRLSQVSGGRYHLRGSPEEIHIVDHLEGGEERDLRTLSGGETFMASLALALALSDAIQGERGGGYPPVDFFFLDEGFGSLDGDSLDTVMRMLRELVDQGIHVGLITHVSDVRKYVPRRLLVEPADETSGSRVRIER